MNYYYKITNGKLFKDAKDLLEIKEELIGCWTEPISHSIILDGIKVVAEIIPIKLKNKVENMILCNPLKEIDSKYTVKLSKKINFLKIGECGKNRKIDLDFILPGLPRKCVGTLVSPGGTGKSLAILQTAANCVIGKKELLNQSLKKRVVAYISLEDPEEVLNNRMHDLYHQLKPTDKETTLLDINLLACATKLSVAPSNKEPVTPEEITQLFANITPDLIILDTARRAHQLEENSTGEMSLFISALETIADTLNCAILILHHTSKSAAYAAGKGEDVGSAASRGSTVLVDNARAVWSLQTMNVKDADKKNISSDERKNYLKLEQTKCNYQRAMKTQWLERINNGFFINAEFNTENDSGVFNTRDENNKYAK